MKKNYNIKMYHYGLSLLLFLSCVLGLSCKKFIEVDTPVTSTSGSNVYTEDANAIAAITGVYAKMSATRFSLNMSLYPELSADNFSLFSSDDLGYTQYFQNGLIAKYGGTPEFWSVMYNYIFSVNDAISGLNGSIQLTPGVKQHLLGEAYFLRAFLYFYLVNMYGPVPLALTTNYAQNGKLSRASEETIYQQIIADSFEAKKLLPVNYVDATVLATSVEKVRPNRLTVDALLARVYLYQKNYDAAEKEATEVIQSTNLYSSNISLDQVFLANSPETIWALQPVNSGINTEEAILFIPSQGMNSQTIYLSKSFMDAFESGDLRKKIWVDSIDFESKLYHFPSKYKVVFGSPSVTEYPIVLRLSEQYLIRSEARAKLNNVSGSKLDLNVIRNRAGLPDNQSNNVDDLLSAILKERRIEMVSEWGQRWLDLKRSGTINSVMGTVAPSKGGGVWQSFKALYPIPFDDIRLNTNLIQNQGYN